MIQIRNVPDDVHRKLKVRAAAEGVTLSELLAREARRVADQPSIAELRERLLQRERFTPRVSPARAVRATRDER
jgi:plasmid stability protein